MKHLSSRLSRNTFALLISNGGSAVLSFLLSILIGRVLGQEGLGIYATVLAWIFPLSLMAEFGLGTLITRDVAQNLNTSHAYLHTSVLARLLIGGFLVAIIWGAAPLLSNNADVARGLRIAAPLIIILPFYSSLTAIFRAHEIMQPIAFLNLGMLVSQVVLTAIAVSQNMSVLVILAINTATSAGQLVAAWVIYRLRFYRPTKKRLQIIDMLKAAMPFAIAAVLAAIQARVTIILLERFAPLAIVGAYAAAARFLEAGRLIPHAFFDALFPRLSALADDKERLESVFRQVMMGLIGFGILFAVGMSIIARPLILWSFGEQFTDSIAILLVLVWSLLPLLLKSGRTLYWYARRQEMYVNRVTAFVILVQIALSFWLIPSYGAIGAAIVIIASETIAAILLFVRRD